MLSLLYNHCNNPADSVPFKKFWKVFFSGHVSGQEWFYFGEPEFTKRTSSCVVITNVSSSAYLFCYHLLAFYRASAALEHKIDVCGQK